MHKYLLFILLFSTNYSQNIRSEKAVGSALDNLHLYASQASGKKYIDLFS